MSEIVEQCKHCPNWIISEENAKKFVETYTAPASVKIATVAAKELKKLRSQNARYKAALEKIESFYNDNHDKPQSAQEIAREALKVIKRLEN